MKDSSQQPNNPATDDISLDDLTFNTPSQSTLEDLSSIFSHEQYPQRSLPQPIPSDLQELINESSNIWTSYNQTPVDQLKQITAYVNLQNLFYQYDPTFSSEENHSNHQNITPYVTQYLEAEQKLQSDQQNYKQTLENFLKKHKETWNKFKNRNQKKISLINPEESQVFLNFLTLINHNDDIWEQLLIHNYKIFKDLLHHNSEQWKIILNQPTNDTQSLMVTNLKVYNTKILAELNAYNDKTWLDLQNNNQSIVSRYATQISEPIKSMVKILQDIRENRKQQLQDFYDAEIAQWQILEQYNDLQWQQQKLIVTQNDQTPSEQALSSPQEQAISTANMNTQGNYQNQTAQWTDYDYNQQPQAAGAGRLSARAAGRPLNAEHANRQPQTAGAGQWTARAAGRPLNAKHANQQPQAAGAGQWTARNPYQPQHQAAGDRQPNGYGYDNGYDYGYDYGYDNGYDYGYDNGYDYGYDNGYDNGYYPKPHAAGAGQWSARAAGRPLNAGHANQPQAQSRENYTYDQNPEYAMSRQLLQTTDTLYKEVPSAGSTVVIKPQWSDKFKAHTFQIKKQNNPSR
jgi:hypothetical protein